MPLWVFLPVFPPISAWEPVLLRAKRFYWAQLFRANCWYLGYSIVLGLILVSYVRSIRSISKPLSCSFFVGQNRGSSIFILVFISLTHAAVLMILSCTVFMVALAYSVPLNTCFCRVCMRTYAIECINKRNWLAVNFVHDDRSDLRYNLWSLMRSSIDPRAQ